MQIPRNPIRPIMWLLCSSQSITAARCCQAWRSRHQVQQLQGFWGWCRTKVCDKVVGLNLTRSQALFFVEKDWNPPTQSSNYIYNYNIYIYITLYNTPPKQIQMIYVNLCATALAATASIEVNESKIVKTFQNVALWCTLTMPACRSITGTILAASCRWIAPQSWAACRRFQLSSDVSAQQLHAAPSKASPWGLLRVASAFKFFIASSQSGEVGTVRKQ